MQKEIKLEELKQLQLDILVKVHEFCIKNNIEYFLSDGTLIGAIRHKGYIPWDDDIDISMTRPNYDKFIKTFNGAYKDLTVYAPELNWNFYAPYANVCDNRTILKEGDNGHNGIDFGIKIDVFPIDGVSSDYKKYLTAFKKIKFYNATLSVKRRLNLWNNKNKIGSLKSIILYLITIPFSYTYIQKNIHKIALQHTYSKSEYATQVTFFSKPRHFRKEIFESYIDVDFEGYKLRTIANYDTYLRTYYGDYMQLPPENERVGHHGFTAYWLDKEK